MREITQKELRQIQLIQLDMLKEVDRICKKCGIHYNIIAGTLLGAVRHGGFIPWDDDADVALLRPEYEKFRKACKTELDHTKYVFQDHRNTKGYRWGYGKLRRKDTLFLREFQERMPYFQGIFIDIFPLDNVPDFYPARALKNLECFCVRKILWAPVGKIADKNPPLRGVYTLLDKIPVHSVFRYYHGMIRRAGRSNSKWVRILTFPTPNRGYGYLKKWYEHSADTVFEKTVFDGIADYDGYLTFKFENYRELPPAEKRKTHPVTKLILLKEERDE